MDRKAEEDRWRDLSKAWKSLEIRQGGANSPPSSMKAIKNHGANFWSRGPKNGGIELHLEHPSKGGGETKLEVLFPPSCFEALAMEMMISSPSAAIQAFQKALLRSTKS